MQFKYPELFYAFFLLLVPILIHLFQLRKFKTELFTNVAFLKHLKLKTRKSSQLKKWLVLASRLLFLAMLVFAFAQPFYSKFKQENLSKETVIYLDNSYSLKAKGQKGELFQEALQDLISKLPNSETISVLTNTEVYRNTTLKAIKNELLKTPFTANQIPYKSALLKASSLFSKNEESRKNLIFVSDFQDNNVLFDASKKGYQLDLVQLKPENTNNTFIDSIYIAESSINTKELVVKIGSKTNKEELLPLSLYNDNVLVTKSSITTKNGSETRFTIPNTESFNGKISFNDNNLAFDNDYYFSIKKQDFINVLEIKSATANDFLKRIYTKDEFVFTSVEQNQLDYSLIEKQNTIILNDLEQLPQSLISALLNFKTNGASIIVIPNKESNVTTYNTLLKNLNFGRLDVLNSTKKSITNINYAHPLYAKNVFEKQVKNFQYPTVNSFFNPTFNNTSSVLKFENNTPFLASKNNTFVFTASLNNGNSNFTLQNLVVPTFYNIALQSLPTQQLNYRIGETHNISINNQIDNDKVIHLKNGEFSFIPLQKKQKNNVILTTSELPEVAGHYKAQYVTNTLQTLSYNYNTKESVLRYHNLNAFDNVSTNLSTVINSIQSDFKINALWKWFVIFALLFLCIEMLLLKFLK